MPIQVETVRDLGEYMNKIGEIAGGETKNMKPPILWFRGEGSIDYSLIPSLFRKGIKVKKVSGGHYTGLHYAEDIRMQHYMAKNYHLLSAKPSTKAEWLEVMQHHQTSTRVLDWSESSIHSLIFALEAFFVDGKFDEEKRKRCVPCVWILKPQELNEKIIIHLAGDESIQRKLLQDLNLSPLDKRKILDSFKAYRKIEDYSKTVETSHIDYILNLSSIDDEIKRNRVRLKELLMKKEVINPFYYVINRIYSDGFILEERKLPPLCAVHPYHSDRIKVQRGVFCVFPFYEEHKNDDALRKCKIIPEAMEYNSMAQGCLYKILIKNPQNMAMQLMQNGMNDSWLYPEMPVVSSEIENHKIW